MAKNNKSVEEDQRNGEQEYADFIADILLDEVPTPKGYRRRQGKFLWEDGKGTRCRINLLNSDNMIVASYFTVSRDCEILKVN